MCAQATFDPQDERDRADDGREGHAGPVPGGGALPEADRAAQRVGAAAAAEEVGRQDLQLGGHGEGQGDGQAPFIPRLQGQLEG